MAESSPIGIFYLSSRENGHGPLTFTNVLCGLPPELMVHSNHGTLAHFFHCRSQNHLAAFQEAFSNQHLLNFLPWEQGQIPQPDQRYPVPFLLPPRPFCCPVPPQPLPQGQDHIFYFFFRHVWSNKPPFKTFSYVSFSLRFLVGDLAWRPPCPFFCRILSPSCSLCRPRTFTSPPPF